ncbi:MAG: signal peptidase II [Endomicrobia bacterium]|nr:signal peptidase II [Endomicrobiia bacterium]
MKKPVALAAFLVVLDQLTKYLASAFIAYGGHVKIIPLFNFFNLTNVGNTGAAFSSFQGKNAAFIIFVAVFLVAVSVWLYKNKNKLNTLQKYAFCMIIAGGTGNLIDRIFRGAVVDFLDFGINNLRWPSFNVADSSICIAAALIVIDIFRSRVKSGE